LLLLRIIFTFENTKKSNLKTGTPINISKSFFGKPPGFIDGFGIFQEFRGTGKNEKSIRTSGDYVVVCYFRIQQIIKFFITWKRN
jgi:hypothetical protein